MLSFTYVRQEKERESRISLDPDFDEGFDNLNDFLYQNQDEGQTKCQHCPCPPHHPNPPDDHRVSDCVVWSAAQKCSTLQKRT